MKVNNAKGGRLREMIAIDKAQMLPLNFKVNYIFTPLYVVMSLILLLVFGALMQARLVALGLVCLGVMALLTAGLLVMVPIVRKRAIRAELERYGFDTRKHDEIPDAAEEWDFSDEELSVSFNRYGMRVNGVLYYYNHLQKIVLTGNRYQRVSVMIVFIESPERCIALPAIPKVRKMLENYQITLENQETFDYILSDPEQAFTEIYKKGEVAVK